MKEKAIIDQSYHAENIQKIKELKFNQSFSPAGCNLKLKTIFTILVEMMYPPTISSAWLKIEQARKTRKASGQKFGISQLSGPTQPSFHF